MTEQRSPLDQALDLVLYAPVGLVVAAGEELPRLIEKGRAQMSGQVGIARLVGRFAVAQGQREAGKVVRQAAQVLADLGVLPADRRASEPSPPKKSAAAPPEPDMVESTDDVDAVDTGNGAVIFEVPTPAGADLAIPGYDALSASQVVQRLAGLCPEELEEARAYELHTRGRRTILNKIAQLQTGTS